MQLKRAMLIAVLGLVLALPTQARADWFFTPYIGANFAGETDRTNVNFGGSLGYMGAGVLGLELDFGYAPNFFEVPEVADSNVTTLMANVIVGAPIGGLGEGVRPYVSGGAGLLRTRVNDIDDFFDITDNSFGVNIGVGAMGFLTNNVGIRGDLRYFRNVGDADPTDNFELNIGDLDFWRGSFGVAFRF